MRSVSQLSQRIVCSVDHGLSISLWVLNLRNIYKLSWCTLSLAYKHRVGSIIAADHDVVRREFMNDMLKRGEFGGDPAGSLLRLSDIMSNACGSGVFDILQGFQGPRAYLLLSMTSSILYYEKSRLRSDNTMLLCKEYGKSCRTQA